MAFVDWLNTVDFAALQMQINSQTSQQVERALQQNNRGWNDFLALVSPAAAAHLEAMAQRSVQLTRQYFGNTVQMFIPLYLSNKCTNVCTYCGFSLGNPVKRKTLSMAEIDAEVEAIVQMGFQHILLVTGEAQGTVGTDYLCEAVARIRPRVAHIGIEVQPLEVSDYCRLMKAGVDAVLVYQETYHRSSYAQYHLRGQKQNFDYRLATPERLGEAGVEKIGIGALIGLADWRADAALVAAHLLYLQKHFWRSRYAISFPRLRPCEGMEQIASVISDRQLVQLICAFRLLHPQVELSLSTREPAAFRDQVLPLGITAMSAYSSTEPGGYATPSGELQQFTIDDNRPPQQVAEAIMSQGLEPVWRNWHRCFSRVINDSIPHSSQLL